MGDAVAGRKHSPLPGASVRYSILFVTGSGPNHRDVEVDQVGVVGRSCPAGGDAVAVMADGAGRALIDNMLAVQEGLIRDQVRAVVALVAQGRRCSRIRWCHRWFHTVPAAARDVRTVRAIRARATRGLAGIRTDGSRCSR
jgi:hypothetical protein